MRIGLIGLGRIGAFHARTLSELPDVQQLFVTDAVSSLAGAVGGELDATVVDTPEELFARGVHGVVIASSTPTHASLIRAAVAHGVPTFCEKPVTQGLADALGLREELANSPVAVQIGFPRRFDKGYVAAREQAHSGALGYLHTVRSTTLDPAPPPSDYIAVSGGIFHDCAVHDYDSVRWATGQEVVEVVAVGATQGVDYIEAAGDVESATTVLTLSGRTIAVVSDTRCNGRGYDVRFELSSVRRTPSAQDSTTGCRSARPTRRSGSRPGSPGPSSWTGSPTRSARSCPRSPKSWRELWPHRAPSMTASRRRSSPRPRLGRGGTTDPSHRRGPPGTLVPNTKEPS